MSTENENRQEGSVNEETRMSAVMVVISLITETIITTDTTTTANSVSIVPALTITVREENALIALHIIMVSVLLTIVIIMANVRSVPVSILTVKKVVNASIVLVLIIIVKGGRTASVSSSYQL